ncbi:hypothetical protein KQX54_010592 [Cotesia glomerata]|uniref:Uncharacterized protein n=1 Tax=Cotesia glomerata TaxID=32391 RepID=A0AAV7I2R2_COTGL|nr:hypothetical protein KQX54_010592 [Cotesia glomerata]
MGRVCAVKNCNTGSAADKKLRRITRILNLIPLIVDPPQCTTINYGDVQVLNKRIELQGKEFEQCQQQQHQQLQQQQEQFQQQEEFRQQEEFQQQEKQQNEFQQ